MTSGSPSPRATPTSPRAASARGEGRGEGQRLCSNVGVRLLPLTLALSPQAGRGDSARRLLRASTLLVAATLCGTTSALAAGGGDVSPFVYQLMVFVVAIFVGYYVVWSVTPALHTPLMSVTNAISSVIVVGALLAAGVALAAEGSLLAKIFGVLALVMASVNIFGGFLVTQRMLGMYRKREPRK